MNWKRSACALTALAAAPIVGGAWQATPALADECVSADGEGICFSQSSTTVPSQTVGGLETIPSVTIPAESLPTDWVTSPTSICVLITCIQQGQPLAPGVTTPSVTTPGESVPLPSETTPPVTVPLPNGYYFVRNQCVTTSLRLVDLEAWAESVVLDQSTILPWVQSSPLVEAADCPLQ